MALSSASTYTQIVAEYKDTASWRQDRDIDLAKRFEIAVRFLLLDRPKSTTFDGANVSHESLRDELAEVREFINSHSSWGGEPGVTYIDLRNLRRL